MLASYKWICELAGFSPGVDALVEKFTFSGLEVAAVRHRGPEFENVVVANITDKVPHPDSAKLSIATVDDGRDTICVVCGAGNCPGAGGQVVLARTGARVGAIDIEPRSVAGVLSQGMLCSEAELDLGPDSNGIIVLAQKGVSPGTPIVDALELEDWILELEVTPNRPDALCHIGLARETCALFHRDFAPAASTSIQPLLEDASDIATVDVRDTDGCPRYSAAIMRGITVSPSPFFLRYRLHNLGIRPISNIVDATNIVLMEYGHPLHAFDLNQLAGNHIVVRRACADESIHTLDGENRTLSPDDLLICDTDRPIAIAGIMGGLDSEVTTATSDILIECAYFTPGTIRCTSKRLKLSSESSYRFERGVDPNGATTVLEATVTLISQLAGGTPARGIIDHYKTPISPIKTRFRPEFFARIMGREVSLSQAAEIITRLGGSVSEGVDYVDVDIPTFRPDMSREIDVVEEVSRVLGMDTIPASLPRIQCTPPSRDGFDNLRKTREFLASRGLQEAITYSFVSRSLLQALHMDRDVVLISNPLNEERSAMRTTLIAGLLENLQRARSRYIASFAQFEVARTFHHDPDGVLPREITRGAAILNGPKIGWIGDNDVPYDVYDIKAVVTELCRELTGNFLELVPDTAPFMHPKRCMRVYVDGRATGVMGELHPAVLKTLKLDKGAVGFELDIDPLFATRTISKAMPLCDYPPMNRDVALVVPESQDAGPIADALQKECGDWACDIRLFDIYTGDHLSDGFKSLAFSIEYRSFDQTLTDKQVDKAHHKGVAAVCNQFGASMR